MISCGALFTTIASFAFGGWGLAFESGIQSSAVFSALRDAAAFGRFAFKPKIVYEFPIPYDPANEYVCLLSAKTCAPNEDPKFVAPSEQFVAFMELATAVYDVVMPSDKTPRDRWLFTKKTRHLSYHLAIDLTMGRPIAQDKSDKSRTEARVTLLKTCKDFLKFLDPLSIANFAVFVCLMISLNAKWTKPSTITMSVIMYGAFWLQAFRLSNMALDSELILHMRYRILPLIFYKERGLPAVGLMISSAWLFVQCYMAIFNTTNRFVICVAEACLFFVSASSLYVCGWYFTAWDDYCKINMLCYLIPTLLVYPRRRRIVAFYWRSLDMIAASQYRVLADRIHKSVCYFNIFPRFVPAAEPPSTQHRSSAYAPPPPHYQAYGAYPVYPSAAYPSFAGSSPSAQRSPSGYSPPTHYHPHGAYSVDPSTAADPEFARLYRNMHHSNARAHQRQQGYPVHPFAPSNPYPAPTHTY
jgi:hypothetical protein